MRIEIELFATLARFLPSAADGRAVVEVPEGATVADVASRLGLPPGIERVALVNGREAEEDRPLAPGDVVTLFPPLAGGAARCRDTTAAPGVPERDGAGRRHRSIRSRWYTRKASEASRNPVGLPDFKSGVRL